MFFCFVGVFGLVGGGVFVGLIFVLVFCFFVFYFFFFFVVLFFYFFFFFFYRAVYFAFSLSLSFLDFREYVFDFY